MHLGVVKKIETRLEPIDLHTQHQLVELLQKFNGLREQVFHDNNLIVVA